jgi:hypothetical protein
MSGLTTAVNLLDFTLAEYTRLLQTLDGSDWTVLTVREFLEAGAPPEPSVVLRHDVDRRVPNALEMAEREAEHGIAASYYFRTDTFQPDAVRRVAALGHEVGYHYEDLAKTRGDHEAARRRFARNLSAFREVADVRTVCAHGSPLSPHQNLDLWRGALDELTSLDLIGEAYLSIDLVPESDRHYLSDTGRTWGGTGSTVEGISSTAELSRAVRSDEYPALYLLAHPCRWARSRLELAEFAAWDVGAELAKSAVGSVNALRT